MNDIDEIFDNYPKPEVTSVAPFDKGKWIEKKQAERKAAFTMIDKAADDAISDVDLFTTILNVMARFDRYSVGNILLITAQMPGATKLADFDTWKQNGCFIKKGEESLMLLEPGDEYTREDGSIGVSYNVKKVFDVSQTSAKASNNPSVRYDQNLLLRALAYHAPCKVERCDALPNSQTAIYDPEVNKVMIRNGMTAEEIFRRLGQELAVAYMHKGEGKAGNYGFLSFCVSYILCMRYGINPPAFRINTVKNGLDGMTNQQIRAELGKIRNYANQLSMDMNRFLELQSKDKLMDSR